MKETSFADQIIVKQPIAGVEGFENAGKALFLVVFRPHLRARQTNRELRRLHKPTLACEQDFTEAL